eukprot:TRINITY_DN98426_c0_g1_i1.p1 TRINITY_DN98426_c0_g1~~TRINITY_DN98426_c0_g1_i1.p1  ORF type:complete len:141 (-),score=11.83 TRINITY_DN98426_c0_g1_i1:213-635(-)
MSHTVDLESQNGAAPETKDFLPVKIHDECTNTTTSLVHVTKPDVTPEATGCETNRGCCFACQRLTRKYSWKSVNALFAVLALNAFIAFVAVNALCSVLSVNAAFSILSMNSVFSIGSFNSAFAIGCYKKAFKICLFGLAD